MRVTTANPEPREEGTPAHRLLSEVDAAEFLGLSIRTLQSWRLTGAGPVYSKIGSRVRYARADLDAFVAANRRHHTSEVAR